MTAKVAKSKPVKRTKPTGPNGALTVGKKDDESEAKAVARAIVGPNYRHGMAVSRLLQSHMGGPETSPGLGDFADAILARGDKAAEGDLEFASRMLAAQAITLDTIFAEMARRMAQNMGEYLGATETYARIALKAQANSRATLEALAKLHQPREQTVRHVHVNEGGQAVIADQFHHHTGGQGNGQSVNQSHAQGSCGPALLGADPCGNGVPIPSGEGEAALPHARGDESGRT